MGASERPQLDASTIAVSAGEDDARLIPSETVIEAGIAALIREFPELDTSGANSTYAPNIKRIACSLFSAWHKTYPIQAAPSLLPRCLDLEESLDIPE